MSFQLLLPAEQTLKLCITPRALAQIERGLCYLQDRPGDKERTVCPLLDRAHVFICVLSYLLEKILEKKMRQQEEFFFVQ